MTANITFLNSYLEIINKRFKTGISREHSYRGDLQNLIQELAPEVLVTNEPAGIECGSPDYIITKDNIPIGIIEAKDIGMNLDSKEYKEQFDRYKRGEDNLIITDYLEFRFYLYRDLKTTITIGQVSGGKITPVTENFAQFTDLAQRKQRVSEEENS